HARRTPTIPNALLHATPHTALTSPHIWLSVVAVVQEFLAVGTNGRVFADPTPLERACEWAGSWLARFTSVRARNPFNET
ncbi:MAG: hypothetical protein KGN78_14355, partial [Actinomycetales bacterium]|nr:hypothetical protein [Actinomycetales bacterium]